jgi:hypothetical protein
MGPLLPLLLLHILGLVLLLLLLVQLPLTAGRGAFNKKLNDGFN